MTAGDTKSIGNLVARDVYHVRKFLGRRLALVLLFEAAERLVDLVQRAYLVEREADNTALFCQSLEY